MEITLKVSPAMTTDLNTKLRARWLRQRLEGKVPPDILIAMTDEELIEQYEAEQLRKLERIKTKHARPEKE